MEGKTKIQWVTFKKCEVELDFISTVLKSETTKQQFSTRDDLAFGGF